MRQFQKFEEPSSCFFYITYSANQLSQSKQFLNDIFDGVINLNNSGFLQDLSAYDRLYPNEEQAKQAAKKESPNFWIIEINGSIKEIEDIIDDKRADEFKNRLVKAVSSNKDEPPFERGMVRATRQQ